MLDLHVTQKFIPNNQLMHNTDCIYISETTKWYTCWLPHVIAQDKDCDKKLSAGHDYIPLNYVANDDSL